MYEQFQIVLQTRPGLFETSRGFLQTSAGLFKTLPGLSKPRRVSSTVETPRGASLGASQISAQQYWTESDVGGGGGQIRMLS